MRPIQKFCRLKNKEVTLLSEESSKETGGQGGVKWIIKKCFGRDKSCEDLGCKYAPQLIGGMGIKDPFPAF
ncbi:MAG: hypothetical protein KJ838_01095 [Candidatus Omnitrophica bacterium]|nr:hypothetical protein [Candidatus Omnitrophota bacterium]